MPKTSARNLSNYVYSGQCAAGSGVIGNSQRSSLVLTTNTLAGAGSFDLLVSSEHAFDNLEFYLNGSLLKRWSGETSWTSSTTLPLAGSKDQRLVKPENRM